MRWQLYRTPLASAIKMVRRAAARKEIARRRALAAELPPDPRASSAARRLIEEGHADLGSLVSAEVVDRLLGTANRLLLRAERAATQQLVGTKRFWNRLLDPDRAEGPLPSDHPFVAFAASPPILRFASEALDREIPILDDVLLTLSKPSPEPFEFSQLWHRDHDDPRTLKIFVYLSDVTSEADGPFTFFPGPTSDRIGYSIRSHRPDDAILPRAGREPVAKLGRAGTCFAVETSRCLHMGSRVAQGHSRLLLTLSYLPAPRLYPPPPARFRLLGMEPASTVALLRE
ncbi:hypothetical protein [Thermaurantiacus sp.]